jgi:hypothetical protein
LDEEVDGWVLSSQKGHEQQPVGVLVDLGYHTMCMLELEDRVPARFRGRLMKAKRDGLTWK